MVGQILKCWLLMGTNQYLDRDSSSLSLLLRYNCFFSHFAAGVLIQVIQSNGVSK